MSDLISRSALLEALKDEQNDGAIGMDFYAFDDIVNEQPAIEAVPVVHGEWIVIDEICGVQIRKCSACGKEHATLPKPYCCYCGASMKGGV